MPQSLFTMAFDVQPRNVEALRRRILEFRAAVETPQAAGPGVDPYDAFATAVPGLHFASIMIFEDAHYDPLLTVEMNVDGDPGTFLPQIEIPQLQPFFREMIRCCKRPRGGAGDMYDAVVATGSKVPLTPFLESRIIKPAVFHQGNRGLDRDRIHAEAALFVDAQKALAAPALYRATDARDVHQGLRDALIGKYAWLAVPEPERWSFIERVCDYARLLRFIALTFFCLSAPGMILALLTPWWVTILIGFVGALILSRLIPGLASIASAFSEATPKIPDLPLIPPTPLARKLAQVVSFVLFVVAYIVLVAFVFAVLLAPFHIGAFDALYCSALRIAVVGFFTIELPIMAILVWIRWLEDRDPVLEDPHDDPEKLRAIMALEDQISQNHMGSVVLIKPGVLRSVILRAGLWGLGYLLRVQAMDGYLASMRTIHFAHWAIVSDGSRLAFYSNFDSSWESYLDDFIEKAHAGLTLAWTNGIGFPYTQFLVNEGASNGRLFKAWARHSMAEGLFWFSAYKDLSVNQIERQYRIAKGLRQPTLSQAEANIWIRDL